MNETFNIEDRVQVELFKIEDKMDYLKDVLVHSKNTTFTSIIKESKSKTEIIVTFLALLELIKLKDVRVVQHGNFGEIYLEGVMGDE